MTETAIDTGARRGAIMNWRDEATLDAVSLLHSAAASAIVTLELQVEMISTADAIVVADAEARKIVRPAMRDAAGEALERWFMQHARQLRQIDSRLEALALCFTERGGRPTLPPDEPMPAPSWSAGAWMRGPASIGSSVGQGFQELARLTLPDSLREGAAQVSARIAREIGERSGLRDRIRTAGRRELTASWLGPVLKDDEQRPVLTQLLDMVDRTALQAKEVIT